MVKKQECKNDHFLQNITRRVVLKLESEFQNYGFEWVHAVNWGNLGHWKRYTLSFGGFTIKKSREIIFIWDVRLGLVSTITNSMIETSDIQSAISGNAT
jgi:hypothetical protein